MISELLAVLENVLDPVMDWDRGVCISLVFLIYRTMEERICWVKENEGRLASLHYVFVTFSIIASP
jgi:hypothetical protein